MDSQLWQLELVNLVCIDMATLKGFNDAYVQQSKQNHMSFRWFWGSHILFPSKNSSQDGGRDVAQFIPDNFSYQHEENIKSELLINLRCDPSNTSQIHSALVKTITRGLEAPSASIKYMKNNNLPLELAHALVVRPQIFSIAGRASQNYTSFLFLRSGNECILCRKN